MAKIYLISKESFDLGKDLDVLEQAFQMNKVSAFQLRLKNQSTNDVKLVAQEVIRLCKKHNVLFILNDNLDLAIKLGAGGVHLGVDDYSDLGLIKEGVPKNFVIGVSCYNSKDLALDSALAQVDYISFGAFFPSKTKKSRGNPDPSILSWANEIFDIPVVAIGGINKQNCKILVDAGADFVAVVSYFWDHSDPKLAIEELHRNIN